MERGDIIEHYKGGLYVVLEPEAKHTEGEEVLVVYRPLMGPGVFARPREMFDDPIQLDDGAVTRFTIRGNVMRALGCTSPDKLIK